LFRQQLQHLSLLRLHCNSLLRLDAELLGEIAPAGDLDKIKPGFEAALRAEVAKIVEKIPAKDLAIQWDCSAEVQDVYGAIPQLPREDAIERNVAQVRNIVPSIPEDVALGYHLCFGTLGGWPRFQPDSLDETVKLANAFLAASGRRVDWIHIPLLDTTDDGLHSYGEGIWLLHDHNEHAFTTDGVSPGGDISAIAYESYLDANGWPVTHGIDWRPFFSPEYYRRKIPVWVTYDDMKMIGEAGTTTFSTRRLAAAGFLVGALAALFVRRRPRRRGL